jgi:hypothetical protein
MCENLCAPGYTSCLRSLSPSMLDMSVIKFIISLLDISESVVWQHPNMMYGGEHGDMPSSSHRDDAMLPHR